MLLKLQHLFHRMGRICSKAFLTKYVGLVFHIIHISKQIALISLILQTFTEHLHLEKHHVKNSDGVGDFFQVDHKFNSQPTFPS